MAIVKGKLEVLDLNIARSAKLDGKYLFSEINGVLSNNKGQLNLTKMGLLPRSVDVLNTESTEFFWYTNDAKNVPDMNEYAHSMSIKSVNMTTVFTFNDKGKVLYRNKKNDTWDTVWTPLATEQFVVDTVNDALNGGGIDLSNYYKKSESDNKFMNRVGNIIIQNGTDFPMITYAGSSKIKGGILYNKGEFHIWDQLADGTERYRVKVPTKSGTLLLQGDVYSKDDVDTKFLPTSGGTLTGAFGISTGDYSGLTLYNKTNHLRVEGNPDNSNYMLTLAYRNSDGSNKFVMQIPKGNSVLASQTWVDGIYYKKGVSAEFSKVSIQDGTVKELRIEAVNGSVNQFQLSTLYNNTWNRVRIPFTSGTMALQEDIYNRTASDERYFLSGRTNTYTSPNEVPWNAKSGMYNQAYSGYSDILVHFNQGTGSSTPALQFRAQYSNRGLYYRTSTDASGFQVNWSKIFTSSHPPSASEVGAYSKTESDGKYASKDYFLNGVSNNTQTQVASPDRKGLLVVQNDKVFIWYNNNAQIQLLNNGSISAKGDIYTDTKITAAGMIQGSTCIAKGSNNETFGIYTKNGQGMLSFYNGTTWTGELYHPNSNGTIATQQWANGKFCNVGTGGQLDVFKYGTNGHGYMAWVEQGKRQAYIGFGSAGTNAFTIANERGTASTINLTAGNILANGNTIATQIWSNSNHYTKAESDGKYALKAGNNSQNFNGNEGSFTDVTIRSDIRVKSEVLKITEATSKVKMLNGYTYNLKLNDNRIKASAGIIAQEVQKVLPELVECDDIGLLKVSYNGLIGLLINAVNELEERVSNLEKR